MNYKSKVICIECQALEATIILVPKYNGLRGKCQNCDGEWPES